MKATKNKLEMQIPNTSARTCDESQVGSGTRGDPEFDTAAGTPAY